ncbi:MAG: hypothetical protein U0326_23235 [Polyangiales bacterium]
MSRAHRLALVVPLLVACGGSNPATTLPTTDIPDSSSGSDAMADAGSDAGADASADVTQDASVDTGPADSGAPRVTHVSGGSFAHTCAVLSTGRVRCWGVNDNAQLGVAVVESRQRCRVPGSTSTLPCEHTPRDVPDLTDVTDVSVGNGTSCVLKRDGSVWCWGLNDAGELGQGTSDTMAHPTPVRVTLPMAARQVAAGAFHVCALLTDGTVQCWGDDKYAQSGVAPAMSEGACDPGDGITTRCQRRPRAVDGLTNVRQISLGRFHTCALLNDGTVRCWGLNDAAQIGTGTLEVRESPRTTPTTVTGLSGVTQIAAGGSHTCAVRSDGAVHCWGWNDMGQLGTAATTACSVATSDTFRCALSPVPVPELSGARAVAAGRYHTCVTLTAGGVRCAGRNDEFQLGLGGAGTERCTLFPDTYACTRTFRDVTIPSTAEVTVGNYHSCAALADGTVRCWGAGYYGQIGDGNTMNREAPVATLNLP